MTLLKDEAPISARKLLLTGVPSFVIAMALSMLTHHLAHRFGETAFCGSPDPSPPAGLTIVRPESPVETCAMAALTGQAWSLGLALLSFILMLRYPRNLFLASTAFINASARIPVTLTMFLQYLIHSRSWLVSDESASLSLMNPVDPTIPMVLLCAMSLLLVFFSIIIVHDVKTVRYKWPIAAVLFAGLGVIEVGMGWLLRPLLLGS